jgi:hydrogenase/urease accessory protein HupE
MADAEIRIDGLAATMIDVLVRIEWQNGTVVSQILRPNETGFRVGSEKQAVPTWGYLTLGIEHILLGIDHLLFVLGLMLIVNGTWLLVNTITAFTVAHSITLGLATLGLVHVPQAPVEAVIALSIVFVASELVRQRNQRPDVMARYPWIVAFTFGLLHGFGFAGALAEVGLPQTDIPLALLFFNVGVEIGQLAFIAVMLGVIAAGRNLPVHLPQWSWRIAPYSIGSLAMFWVIQRMLAF